jgi:hypothetical protein
MRWIALAAVVFSLSACINAPGNRVESQPTQGQQLLDLKQALDSGAISQSEFDMLKHEILHDD